MRIEEKQTISPTLLKAAACMATQNSCRESANMLAQLGIHMSHQRVHQAFQEFGEAIEKRQTAEPLTAGRCEADMVVVESDSVHVALQGKDHKKAKSMEIKVGTIYEEWESTSPQKDQYGLKNPDVLADQIAEAYWELVDRDILPYELDKVEKWN